MKKKKKKKKTTDIPLKKSKLSLSDFKYKSVEFIKTNQITLFIFFISFFISLLNNYTASEQNPVIGPHKDPYFYYIISQQVKEKIFNNFFKFIGGVISGSFTHNDYQLMGFVENDIQSIFRAPGAVFLYGFLFFLFGTSYNTILISNSFMYALQVILIYLISRILYPANKKIPLILCIIFLFYTAFHILVMFSNCETIINLSILLLIYFYLLSIKKNKPLFFFITGFLIYYIALVKLSIQYLGFFLFFIIIYIIYKKYKKPQRNKILKSFILGFFTILFLWKFISYRATGEFDITSVTWSKVTDATAGRVGWSALAPSSEGLSNNVGRPHTSFFRESIKEVPIKRNNVWFTYSFICKKAIIKALKKKPFQIILQSIRKAVFLLITPMEAMAHQYNRKFLFSFFMGPPYYIFHNIIILLMLFSLFFFYYEIEKRGILYLVIIFHFLIHSITNAQTRYITTAMPSAIIISGVTLFWLSKNYKKLFSYIYKNRIIIFAAITLIVINSFLKIYITKIILFNILFLLISLIILKISKNFTPFKNSIISAMFFPLFCMVSYNSFVILNKDKDRDLTILRNNDEKIVQKIILPEKFDKNRYDGAILMIDTKIRSINKIDLKIKINDILVKEFLNKLPVSTNILYYVENGRGFTAYENKWLAIPLPLSLFTNKEIEVSIEPKFLVKGKTELIIYSDKNNPPGYFIGPSFFKNFKSFFYANNVSLWTNFIDTRYIEKYKIKSQFRRGYFIKNNNIQFEKDYRVYILFKQRGGYYVKEEYKRLNQLYFGFIAFYRPIENKIVRWLEKPLPGYVPAGRTIRIYIETEFDRYYTGYEIF